jgi:Gluconate 2-dehydrogenase subunit 3
MLYKIGFSVGTAKDVMKKWPRRKFLKAGVVGSIVMRGAMEPGLSYAQGVSGAREQQSATIALDARQRNLLSAAMDEIIPAGDGMPAAGEVGGVDYLNRLARRDKEVANELRRSLSALERLNREQFRSSFLSLNREERVESLIAFQHQDKESFQMLRDYVYEAYYLQPRVRELIGYEFYPTDRTGPRMRAFDEAVLAEVRKKPKYYRVVL